MTVTLCSPLESDSVNVSPLLLVTVTFFPSEFVAFTETPLRSSLTVTVPVGVALSVVVVVASTVTPLWAPSMVRVSVEPTLPLYDPEIEFPV